MRLIAVLRLSPSVFRHQMLGHIMTEHSQIESWVTAAKRGDRLALAKLLTTCHRQLRRRTEARMPAALRPKLSPDDILQEVYLDVVRQIDQFENRGPGSFLNWVYAILEHKVAGAWRAAHCQVRDVARETPGGVGGDASSYWNLLDHLCQDSGTPSRVVRREEAIGALFPCVSDLSEAQRQVIQLRFLEGLSVSEVAVRLDKSEAAVVALSKRALEALRKSMDRMGEFTHGA